MTSRSPLPLLRLLRPRFGAALDRRLAACAENWDRPWLFKLLLILGADPNCPSLLPGTEEGFFPLVSRCARAGNSEMCRTLLEFGADPLAGGAEGAFTPIHQAALKGHGETLRIFAEFGAPIDVPAGSGWTPLLCAARECRSEAVEALLSLGADPDDFERDSGVSALARAASRGDAASIRILARHGADLEAVGPRGWRAVHRAAGAGRLEAFLALVECGADPEASGPFGRTPVHVARSENHLEMAAAIESLLIDRASASEKPLPKGRPNSL